MFKLKKRVAMKELHEVVAKNKSAAILWLGLTKMADKNGCLLTVTREEMAKSCGLVTQHLNNISKALRCLEECGWVDVTRTVLSMPNGELRRVLNIWLRLGSANFYEDKLSPRPAKPRKEHTGVPANPEDRDDEEGGDESKAFYDEKFLGFAPLPEAHDYDNIAAQIEFYTNKEADLRESVSNGTQVLDKLVSCK
jgi:hypothetical protein